MSDLGMLVVGLIPTAALICLAIINMKMRRKDRELIKSYERRIEAQERLIQALSENKRN